MGTRQWGRFMERGEVQERTRMRAMNLRNVDYDDDHEHPPSSDFGVAERKSLRLSRGARFSSHGDLPE